MTNRDPIPSAFGSILSVQRTLRQGIEKGYWTLEDLDLKPEGCETPDERFRNLLRKAPDPAPVVQAAPDPKDFGDVLPTANPPTQTEPLPLTLEQEPETPFVPF